MSDIVKDKKRSGCETPAFRRMTPPPTPAAEFKIEARPWQPQDLVDDLQLMIDEEPDSYLNDRRTTLCMAQDYLKSFFGIDQEPLTAEELMKINGEPVWIVWPDGRIKSNWYITGSARWIDMFIDWDGSLFRDYGEIWLAYRHKPMEEVMAGD